jgi:photosystem II stability/assembly factor-like uncharacterized protein
MKSAFLFAVFFLILQFSTQCQWSWVHPQPCGNPVMSMTATDSMHVWMTATGGTIIYTQNGGIEWKIFQSDSNETMESVSFVDTLRGWVSAEKSAIYKTTNGGISWSRSTINDYYPGDICFTDSLTGWVGSGFDSNIHHTTDGGNNWNTVPLAQGSTFAILDFPDSQHGWVGGSSSSLYHTTDGGITWNLQNSNLPMWLSKLCFTDSLTGYAFTQYDSKIHYTYNSGTTWGVRTSAPFAQWNCFFSDKDHGWVVGFNYKPAPIHNEGRIARTTNGGKTFKDIYYISGRSHITDVTASDSLHAWAWGEGGMILATKDGGITWEQQAMSLGDPAMFNDVYVLKPEHTAWAVGYGGFILKTNDDGMTWEKQESGTAANLTAVQFFDAEHGIAAGEQSTMRKTSDGGEHWDSIPLSLNGYITDIYFLNTAHGWMTINSRILETVDGGVSWNFKKIATVGLLQIVFPDSLHGWAVGNGYTSQDMLTEVVRTKDGGKTWESITLTGFMANSVWFADMLHGWMCGNHGIILRTTDGGVTWDEFIYNQYCTFHSVHFTDALHGWIVGDGSVGTSSAGIALNTDDGGLTWTRKDAGIGLEIFDVFFTDPDYGYAVGWDGSILRWGGENVVGTNDTESPSYNPYLSNYPNPCSDQTIITYTLDNPSNVSLNLYNILGTKIANLAEDFESAGNHQISFKTGFLNSGVYICQLKANKTVQTIKILK